MKVIKPLTARQRHLVEDADCVAMVRACAALSARNQQEREDYEQEGWIAVAKAAANFDASRDVQFTTMARRYVKNRMTDLVRSRGRQVDTVSMDEELDEDGMTRHDLVGQAPAELPHEINGIMKCLTSREQSVIIAHYYNRKTLSRIAKEMRLYGSGSVMPILKSAKAKLKAQAESERIGL